MSKNCQSCGKEIADDAQFCNACGAPQASQQTQSGNSAPPPPNYGSAPNQGAAYTANETFSSEDIEKNKVVAGLAYLIFFLPLVAAPESAFGKFHANQGLLLLIVSVIGGIVLGIIPLIGWIIMPIFYVAVLVFGIMGLVNGLNGKAQELPLFGKYRIIR